MMEPTYIRQVAGRLVCAWFLLTAIGQLWLWPCVISLLLQLKSAWLTAAFFGYIAYTWYGPGSRAAASAAWPKPFRRWRMWRVMADYFGARLVRTAPLDPAGHYLFAVHPHGAIAISAWVNFATEATGFSELFPGLDVRVATLESNFRVPLLREYILLHGMCDASRGTLRKILAGRQPGSSAVLVVGGAAEALLAAPGTYDLVLFARRGFVKLAMQTGAALVPVIAYGETDTFHTYIPPPSSRAAGVIKAIKRNCGFSTPILWGSGLFGGWGMLPLQTQLTTVVGKPLAVERVANPTDEQVEAAHSAYVAALNQLWRETSERYGGRGVKRGLAVVQ